MVLLKQNQSGAEHAKTAKAELSMQKHESVAFSAMLCFCLSKNTQALQSQAFGCLARLLTANTNLYLTTLF
jgi:hypothetical protein